MKNIDQFPPYLPEELHRGWWVGAMDAYAPQISVTRGPSVEIVKEAERAKSSITLDLECRTGDMDDDDESEKLGPIEVRVHHIIEVREGTVCFVGEGELPFSGGSCMMWVWEYDDDGQAAGLDFRV